MTLVAIWLAVPLRMRLSGTVIEIWPFEFIPEISSRNRGRSSVGPQYFTDFI